MRERERERESKSSKRRGRRCHFQPLKPRNIVARNLCLDLWWELTPVKCCACAVKYWRTFLKLQYSLDVRDVIVNRHEHRNLFAI